MGQPLCYRDDEQRWSLSLSCLWMSQKDGGRNRYQWFKWGGGSVDGGAPEWEAFSKKGSAAGERLSWAAAKSKFCMFLHGPAQVHSHFSPTSASLMSSVWICHLTWNLWAFSEKENPSFLTSLGMDKEESMFHAKCIVKHCECHGGGSFKSVISSCLQNEPVTQIYCTHSQELCPKLIPILKSCVFLCMSGGFSGRWKVEEEGMEAWKAGLVTGTWVQVCEPPGPSWGCGVGHPPEPSAPCSHPPPPSPHPLPSLSPSLSPIPSHSLSHFSSSFQLAGITPPHTHSGMFSTRLTSDKTLQTANGWEAAQSVCLRVHGSRQLDWLCVLCRLRSWSAFWVASLTLLLTGLLSLTRFGPSGSDLF